MLKPISKSRFNQKENISFGLIALMTLYGTYFSLIQYYKEPQTNWNQTQKNIAELLDFGPTPGFIDSRNYLRLGEYCNYVFEGIGVCEKYTYQNFSYGLKS